MEKSTLYAFILSFIASISTLIGAFIIFFDKNKENRLVVISLSFASGVMICVSIFDLIPNSYSLITFSNNSFIKVLYMLIFLNIGFILSGFLDKKIESRGSKLYKIGIINMIAIIMHNIPEGIATFITSKNNLKLGIILSTSIALHNIPEGISISVPIYHGSKSKKKALFCSFLSGISEMFGSLLSYLFLYRFVTDNIMAILYLLIAGIMIYISLFELLKTSIKLSNNKKYIIISFIIGFLIMLLSHILYIK